MATYENTRSFHALEIINPAGGRAEGGAHRAHPHPAALVIVCVRVRGAPRVDGLRLLT